MELLERRELLDRGAVAAAYGQIPLSFEPNEGQTDPAVQFLSRGSGYTLFLTSQEAVLSLSRPMTPAPPAGRAEAQSPPPEDVLRLQLVGANPSPQVAGLDPLPGTTNYFIGNDPSKWRTTVRTYGKVEYQDVYPGIDLVYYGNQQQLEYDFVVTPGVNPGVIRLSFQGSQDLTLDSQGNLVLHASGGDVVEHAPVVYQEEAGGRQAVAGKYVLMGEDQVGFEVGSYDTSQPLVLDPVLSYSTYLGGSVNDLGYGIAVDASGNAYMTGYTDSLNFPTTSGALQGTYGGGAQDVFVAKLNSAGTALLYSTYLGGSSYDYGFGIAVDLSGDAYVTGATRSSNFPTTPGAVQTTYQSTVSEAFVAKLNGTGAALLYSTFLGGTDGAFGYGIAVDTYGNAYVTGSTYPVNLGNNVFIAKLNAAGSALLYWTYFGGVGSTNGTGIAIDASGCAYVTGQTDSSSFPTTPGALDTTYGRPGGAFVAKLNSAGSALLYAAYLGGVEGLGIAVDASGNAYITGRTSSYNFPTTPGAVQMVYSGGSDDAFVAKLNGTGSALLYATYLGGSRVDYGSAIAVDAAGKAYVTGYTESYDFPTTPGAIQPVNIAGSSAFVIQLNATATSLLYSTFLGGSNGAAGTSIALDNSGNAYITGYTASSNFPTTPGAAQTTSGGSDDAFVAKITFAQAPVVAFSVAQPLLWPPNNTLINVGLGVTVTPADASLQLLVYATDNASPSDAASIAPGTLQLRSARQGNGTGRVYLIVAMASNAAGTSFDVCAVVVPHDNSLSSTQAVQQRAVAAEAYYQQFHAVPAGFVLLGSSGGGGAAAAPRTALDSQNVLLSELVGVASPVQPLTPSMALLGNSSPNVTVDQVVPTVDRFFASFNKQDLAVPVVRRGQEPDHAGSWLPDLIALESLVLWDVNLR
jgi:hypothetical protein